MTDAANPRARYRRIMRFAVRYLVQEWWFELVLPRFGLERLSARNRTKRFVGIARKFHGLAVELGGLMIKVGQFLSSRLDVLPPEITDELAGLQDEVPAADFAAIRRLAEAELGMPLERAYAAFEPAPLAAASLGQVHRARLAPEVAEDAGFAEIVVKVQRPGIEEIVEVDLAALRRIAGWLQRVRIVREHTDAPALVEEFAHTSLLEIDYLHEAGNAVRFAEDFAEDARVSAPEVAWERTTQRVLTLSDVTAIKIDDRTALESAGIAPPAVATELARIMFDQLFDHGFFHADPHPGNIFVTPVPTAVAASGPASPSEPVEGTPAWKITFVDFGMMGEVPEDLRAGLRRLVIAIAARDGKGLVAGIQDIGLLLPSADTAELERAMTELFARFGGMGFAELQRVDQREFVDFADEFGEVMRTLPFQLPEKFLLIIRAISVTSGVCSSLDPEFNIWNAVEPYADSLLRDEQGGAVRAFGREALATLGIAARLPRRIDGLLADLERGRVPVQTPGADRHLRRVERMLARVISALLFVGLFVGGAVLHASDAVFGTVLLWVSALPLLHALFAGLVRRPPGW
ncbi:ABC1 kinase family protein [Agromyces seonyuensis]|uniref:AarF/ABC1/UbiB kinase family protein n=1 Tax=Agromyces seonyuensis TaxID=2662446 RepID=A0A6I4NSI9_9MICO|nr:AarF/UbiB family protein [Agromyces seonyuensis]MWB97416.1 AarF/ABC1/UbiB kinase family protein [Agromyces seonyuensis]